jgi:hypothetical protein
MSKYCLSVVFEVDSALLTPVKDSKGAVTGFLDKNGDTVRLMPAVGMFWRDGKTGGYFADEAELKRMGFIMQADKGLIY